MKKVWGCTKEAKNRLNEARLVMCWLVVHEGLETLNDVRSKSDLRNSCSLPLIFWVAPGDSRELGDLAWLKFKNIPLQTAGSGQMVSNRGTKKG